MSSTPATLLPTLPPTLLPTLLTLAVLLALMAAIGLWLMSRPRRTRYKQRQLLTANEREFFFRLRRAAPELHIFPQVAMSGIIEPDVPPKKWFEAFARISQKRVDFCVCDDRLGVLCIVELDDATHDPRADAIRDSYTGSAGVKTLRFESRRKPSVPELRSALLPLMRGR